MSWGRSFPPRKKAPTIGGCGNRKRYLGLLENFLSECLCCLIRLPWDWGLGYLAHKKCFASNWVEFQSHIHNKIISNRSLTTILPLLYCLVSFSLGKMSLGSFLLFSVCYCHINVFIFHFLQYCMTFFKICTGPVSLKVNKSPKVVHLSFKNTGVLNWAFFVELVAIP